MSVKWFILQAILIAWSCLLYVRVGLCLLIICLKVQGQHGIICWDIKKMLSVTYYFLYKEMFLKGLAKVI